MSLEKLLEKIEKKLIEATGPDWNNTAYVMGMEELSEVRRYLRKLHRLEEDAALRRTFLSSQR